MKAYKLHPQDNNSTNISRGHDKYSLKKEYGRHSDRPKKTARKESRNCIKQSLREFAY